MRITRFHRFIVVLLCGAGAIALAGRASAQQASVLSHETAQALIASADYLRDQMAKAPTPGRVELDARSLTRLIPESATVVRPRLAQALGVMLADEGRLETCKPVRSVACELGTAQAVVEVRSASVNGAHATVEFRKYTKGAGASASTALASMVMRFNLVLGNDGWTVSKYSIVSG